MRTTKYLLTALVSLMLLTTACDKGKKNNSEAAAPAPGISESCTNCTGFVPGPTVFSGNVSSGAFRIDGLQVTADQNSLASVMESSPRISGTYQAIVSGGTFTASGSACVTDGTYQVQGLKVGMVSPNLSIQASTPLWVMLTGPATYKVPMYIKLADTNSDDMADTGTAAYLWFYCNGQWTSVGMYAQ